MPRSASHIVKSRESCLRSGKYKPIGSSRTDKRGYRYLKIAHGKGESGNWKAEHRLSVECSIGRELSSGEEVHHMDSDTSNNLVQNLAVVSKSQHGQINLVLNTLRKADEYTRGIILNTLVRSMPELTRMLKLTTIVMVPNDPAT